MCNAKWQRQREWRKNNCGSNQQISNFSRAAHFFFLTVKLPETSWLHVLWRKCPTSCSLYFYCRSFSLWWPLAFLIFSTLLKNFLPTKIVSFVFYLSLQLFVTRFLIGLRWPAPNFSLYFLLVFLFLHIPNLWT